MGADGGQSAVNTTWAIPVQSHSPYLDSKNPNRQAVWGIYYIYHIYNIYHMYHILYHIYDIICTI